METFDTVSDLFALLPWISQGKHLTILLEKRPRTVIGFEEEERKSCDSTI